MLVIAADEWILILHAAIIAGAFIPELLRIAVFQKGRIFKENGANLLFAVPCSAMLYDWKNRGYGLHALGDFFTTQYYQRLIRRLLM